VNYLFEKIDAFGSEDFLIDNDELFKKEWTVIKNLRHLDESENLLLKDL
jgi:membrane protein